MRKFYLKLIFYFLKTLWLTNNVKRGFSFNNKVMLNCFHIKYNILCAKEIMVNYVYTENHKTFRVAELSGEEFYGV